MTARDLYNKMLSKDSTCTTIEMMEVFAKISTRFKPLEWKSHKGFDESFVCSSIAGFGYAHVSKTKKGYRAFFEDSGKHFNTLEEAKEYIEKAHQENILQFIEP